MVRTRCSAVADHQPHIVITFRSVSNIAVAGTVKVTASKLRAESLHVSGAGGTSLRIDDLDTRDLKLSGAGALRAEVAGRAADATITISGAGEFRGAKLVTQNASVTVAGAGKVTVNAEKTLKATISGAGSVDYLGDPKVTESVSGAGRVRRREAGTGGTQLVGFSEWARRFEQQRLTGRRIAVAMNARASAARRSRGQSARSVIEHRDDVVDPVQRG
jgi:hypothetical protein